MGKSMRDLQPVNEEVANLNTAIEIVDFPIKDLIFIDFSQFFVGLPDISRSQGLEFRFSFSFKLLPEIRRPGEGDSSVFKAFHQGIVASTQSGLNRLHQMLVNFYTNFSV